jgi:hypothetical protein
LIDSDINHFNEETKYCWPYKLQTPLFYCSFENKVIYYDYEVFTNFLGFRFFEIKKIWSYDEKEEKAFIKFDNEFTINREKKDGYIILKDLLK